MWLLIYTHMDWTNIWEFLFVRNNNMRLIHYLLRQKLPYPALHICSERTWGATHEDLAINQYLTRKNKRWPASEVCGGHPPPPHPTGGGWEEEEKTGWNVYRWLSVWTAAVNPHPHPPTLSGGTFSKLSKSFRFTPRLSAGLLRRGLQRECRLSGWPIAFSYMSPNAEGGGGKWRGLSQWVQLYTGAQINFGDPTSYVTYGTEYTLAIQQGEWRRSTLNVVFFHHIIMGCCFLQGIFLYPPSHLNICRYCSSYHPPPPPPTWPNWWFW